MTEQGDLFEARRLARTDDPSTSHEAAEALVGSGTHSRQKALVLGVVMRHPGCTSAELAYWSGLDRHLVARRLPDLERAGLIARGEPKRCEQTQRKAITWRAVA